MKDLLNFHLLAIIDVLLFVELMGFATCCPILCNCSGFVVDCSYRNLTTVPLNIPDGIRTLLLNGNQIKEIGNNQFSTYNSIKQLDLSNCKIEKLSSTSFHGLYNLKKLYLADNKISSLPNYLLKGLDLNLFSISRNLLKDLNPLAFDGNLTSLYANQLSIERLQRKLIDNLKASLKVVHINYNTKPLNMPLGFFTGTSLSELSLKGNHFKDIEFLYGLEMSEGRMDLSDNEISDRAWNVLYRVTGIKDLLLNNIGLTEISNRYQSESLQFIGLQKNSIREIRDNDFKFGRNLGAIDLQYNAITGIQSTTFKHNKNLTIIELSNNQIEFFDFALFDVNRLLRRLLLRNNFIRSVPITYQHYLKLYKGELDITNNKLHCNCQLQWLKDYLLSIDLRQRRRFKIGVCSTPSNFELLSRRHELKCIVPKIEIFTIEQILNGIEFFCTGFGDPLPDISVQISPLANITVLFKGSANYKGVVKTGCSTLLLFRCIAKNDAGNAFKNSSLKSEACPTVMTTTADTDIVTSNITRSPFVVGSGSGEESGRNIAGIVIGVIVPVLAVIVVILAVIYWYKYGSRKRKVQINRHGAVRNHDHKQNGNRTVTITPAV
ncbi:unnamed protein product [Dimorphilus gyrociliatus]|uniref:LRRNT domain-containing protein n=1 Tax=Dimorphilus gyrociliatus TaxID=2664684 RepID=A0A7I8VLA1_9ANNE|nr:unnamed protein product [Dimorphilus gyrociliatus]